MTRIFWDTNLFIYLLQDDPQFGERVRHLWRRSAERRDEICTTPLALGEILVGVHRDQTPEIAATILEGIASASVKVLPFDAGMSDLFGRIRARHRTSAADSVHLACAATYGVDLFITNDKDLPKLHIPGIKFIVGLNTDIL